jgi:hypothetical protein
MKKREFLAMGGAVPLMLAGCGGSGSGSAQMRLVNASVGYPSLGLLVNTTQATTTDVAYGSASPFAGVPAGSVTTTLTTTSNGIVTNLPVTSRTVNKDARYSLVAYGFANAPKSVLILENQTAPDTGYASLNLLNTSTDLGPIDIYLTAPGAPITGTAPFVSNITGVSQSVFQQITAGTYDITVTGAGKPSDLRQTIPSVQLVDQQIATLILTPGQSGVLANSLLLTQGTSGTVVNYPNSVARIRVIAATGNTGTVSALVGSQLVANTLASPNFTGYVSVAAGTAPLVQTSGMPGGVTVTIGQGQTITTTTLVAGSDYTLLVYGTEAAPAAVLFLDDNRLPLVATNAKVRLLNALLATPPLALTLAINSSSDAATTDIPFGVVSQYDEVSVPTSVQSLVTVTSGFQTIATTTTALLPGNMYTMLVAGELTTDPTTIASKFLAARI